MYRFFVSIIILFSVNSGLPASEKDSPAATNTRKKLQIKVTVDFKNENFSEVVKELKKQIEDANGGALSTVNDAGVSNNTKYTFAAKDQTVVEVLDGLLKKNGVGYVVVSKPGDRYDGWIKFKQGSERGYEGAAPDVAPKPPAKDKDPAPVDDAVEKSAQTKLDYARDLIRNGKKDKAKVRFQEIVRDYPKSKAAGEAKKELEKLNG